MIHCAPLCLHRTNLPPCPCSRFGSPCSACVTVRCSFVKTEKGTWAVCKVCQRRQLLGECPLSQQPWGRMDTQWRAQSPGPRGGVMVLQLLHRCCDICLCHGPACHSHLCKASSQRRGDGISVVLKNLFKTKPLISSPLADDLTSFSPA